MARMLWMAAAALGSAGQVAAQTGSRLFVIDFEGHPEGTPIAAQYAAMGATFSLIGSADLPVIAVEGTPRIAFDGAGADAPMADGEGGLADPVVDGDPFFGQDIAVDFDPPITSIRLYVIDIDGSESCTVRAYDGAALVGSQTRTAGQTGTGNAVASEFFLAAPSITRVEIDVPSFSGAAVDFITFTRPCEGDECGPLIEIAQETSPGAGDFDDNVLGLLLPFPTGATPASFYAYDVPEGDSWNGPSLTPIADRSHLLIAGTCAGRSLVVVHDRAIPDDPDGGRAEMRFEVLGDPSGLTRTVEDDPPSNEAGAGYTGEPGDTVFTSGHRWNPCCTDGLVLSGPDGDWSLFVEFAEIDGNTGTPPIEGMSEWVAYSGDGTQIPLAMEVGRRVRLRGTTLPCTADCNGDGALTAPDFACFRDAFINGLPFGDFNEDCAHTASDFSAFRSAFLGGCPR